MVFCYRKQEWTKTCTTEVLRGQASNSNYCLLVAGKEGAEWSWLSDTLQSLTCGI